MLEHPAVLELPHPGSKLTMFLTTAAPLQDVTGGGAMATFFTIIDEIRI